LFTVQSYRMGQAFGWRGPPRVFIL
jgi:hypothetical protein